MTDLRALLAPIRDRLRWAEDAAVTCQGDGLDKDYINALETVSVDAARLLAAIEAVGGLHQPVTVYEIDPINGTWVYDSETDERKVLTLLCRECTPAFVLDDLDEGEYDGGGSDADVHFPCPTITALAAALGSDTTNQKGTQ